MRKVLVAVIAAQVALPAAMLTARWVDEGSRPRTERPASWQMYSFVPAAAYEGISVTGAVTRLDVGPLPPFVRAVDTGRTVPGRLCARDPSLVEVRRTGGADPGSFRC